MPDTVSIVFVDDDPNVLNGLRRRVRMKRPKWHLRFCSGGAEALGELTVKTADVIVSDMRMPGMDGAELLRSVARQYPDTARILLSGYADEEAIMRGNAATQHFLMKPCSDDDVIHAIERALILQRYLHDPQLTDIIYRMPYGLAWPEPFRRLNAILQTSGPDGETELTAFGDDNAAFIAQATEFARRDGAISPDHRATILSLIDLLGLETIKALCILWSLEMADGNENVPHSGNTTRHQRALSLGLMAGAIARQDNIHGETLDLVRTSALLCHIGLVIGEHVLPDQLAASRFRADADQCDIVSAEIAEIGVSHPALSAGLVALWGFKHEIVENIAFHHRPETSTTQNSRTLLVVYAAQHFARLFGHDGRQRATKYDRADSFIERCNAAGKWTQWQNLCAKLGDSGPA